MRLQDLHQRALRGIYMAIFRGLATQGIHVWSGDYTIDDAMDAVGERL